MKTMNENEICREKKMKTNFMKKIFETDFCGEFFGCFKYE